ncbi:selenocysteine-specific translation elongation factor [Verrucomicrobiaceae bacterium 5K15]|uniref:Selenocysteine-specific translation elongation factor n=1 Tax=Oceaniferula flava TaxID=2800421 RepID=A0AAE2SBA0_9BACT|nr:selenocysteine-specific translation elongation factor [Oceaniferula flavus]MBK1853749.1 selenocysteine-specific translation elongation factor [Oceaniferula flavus]MBM1135056.1 selenocysteine-specific translation elongation factor [Oceaniferula flavus]
MSSYLVLGTAGHIDHGKSSLVKCLTGSDPDRLPEEKSRGVTIELGFAHMALTDGEAHYEIGIVDVPGHADFVNNMVAGVGALDLAIFIIAADDGWMPQSEEHLHILSYLGIKNIVIALTKADLCEDVPFSIEVLRDELKDTSLADAPIVPVSSVTGDGIDALQQVLLENLHHCPQHPPEGKARLAIDRIFSPKGTGTVVTGTLSGGAVHVGDSLTLQPLGLETKIRYIQNHNQSLETALPGMRTALNVPDLPIAGPGKTGAQRGHSLCAPHIGTPTDTVDIHLQRLARPIPGFKARALKNTETVMLHHGSTRCQARVILNDRTQLHPGEDCLAQLRLETPLLFLTGDRVVLRDGSQQSTLAGGTVLDAQPRRQGFRTEAREHFLQARATSPDTIPPYLSSLLERDHQIPQGNPLPNSPFHPKAIAAQIKRMLSEGSIISHGGLWLDAPWWNAQLDAASKAINTWHRKRPDIPAMPTDELAKQLPELPPKLLLLLPEAMEQRGFLYNGKGLANKKHQLTLPEEIAPEAQAILKNLQQCGLQPPNKADLTASAKSEQAMKFLIRSGQVIELDPKVVISTEVRNHAADRVTSFISERGQATASELRQHLDSTRKVVMPLLEHLDAIGLTIRNDNYRTLAQ